MNYFISVYELGFYFFIYSFLGWMLESLLNTLRQKTFVNRGFLVGPYCPIYGVGMCSLYLLCFPIRTQLPIIFFSGMLFATLLEYLTGLFMEKLFHARWWDYSRFKYNVHGYICLHISLIWGILAVIFIGYIHPIIIHLVTLISTQISIFLLDILCLLFIIDFIYSIRIAFKLTNKFPALADIRLEMITFLEQCKFYETAEEFKLRFELKKVPYKVTDVLTSLKEQLPKNTNSSKAQLHDLLAIKLSKYHSQLNKFTLAEKRLLKAFPSLSLSSSKNLRKKS